MQGFADAIIGYLCRQSLNTAGAFGDAGFSTTTESSMCLSYKR